MPVDSLCLSGLLLGFRHGFDIDHVTAISDLVTAKVSGEPDDKKQTISLRFQACILAIIYTVGHAVIVVSLGLIAILFRATLPKWIDPVMERLVGGTLILLGLWMVYELVVKRRLRSRGIVLLQAVLISKQVLLEKFLHRKIVAHSHRAQDLCDARCAFCIGAFHGIGAETGTQVLLLTSVGAATTLWGSSLMLISFISGVLISNIGLALLISEGYFRVVFSKQIASLVGLSVALFSVLVGIMFIVGQV